MTLKIKKEKKWPISISWKWFCLRKTTRNSFLRATCLLSVWHWVGNAFKWHCPCCCWQTWHHTAARTTEPFLFIGVTLITPSHTVLVAFSQWADWLQRHDDKENSLKAMSQVSGSSSKLVVHCSEHADEQSVQCAHVASDCKWNSVSGWHFLFCNGPRFSVTICNWNCRSETDE